MSVHPRTTPPPCYTSPKSTGTGNYSARATTLHAASSSRTSTRSRPPPRVIPRLPRGNKPAFLPATFPRTRDEANNPTKCFSVPGTDVSAPPGKVSPALFQEEKRSLIHTSIGTPALPGNDNPSTPPNEDALSSISPSREARKAIFHQLHSYGKQSLKELKKQNPGLLPL